MPASPVNPNLGQTLMGSGLGVPPCDLAFGAHLQVTPALGATTAVLAATTMPTSGTTVVTAGITNPAVARNLTVTGNQAGIGGNVVIVGTNLNDEAITETIVPSGTSTVVGNKAFATVTSITIPARNGAGDTVSVGTGAKLGLRHKLAHNTVFLAFLNNVKEGTLPTVATSTSALESNTFTMNSALNGTVVDIYYWA